MAGETKSLSFSEGVTVAAGAQNFLTAAKLNVYANDAAYVTAKTSAATMGDCYYNSTLLTARIYNGTVWKSLGSLSAWLTAQAYQVDDVVHTNNVIYKCLIGHTSGTFLTDLNAGKWVSLGITSSFKQGYLADGDGVTDTFVLPSAPVSKASLIMIVDVPCDASEYTLVGSTVQFISGSIPQAGQKVSYYYSENSAPAQPTAGCLEVAPWYHTVSAGEITAKQLTLPITPTDGTRVVVDIPTGAPQTYGIDFIVTANILDWNGLGMEADISAGQKIRILIFN